MKFKFVAFCLISIFLTACGFKPIYHKDYKNSALDNFYFEKLSDDENNIRANFFLNNQLEKLFLHSKHPKYLIKIDYSVEKEDYLIQEYSIANMKKIRVKLNYKIYDYNDKNLIYLGTLKNFGSFSTTKSPYLDYVTEEDFIIKMLSSMVQELRMQLLAKYL